MTVVRARRQLQDAFDQLDRLLVSPNEAPALQLMAALNVLDSCVRLVRELTDPTIVRVQRRRNPGGRDD